MNNDAVVLEEEATVRVVYSQIDRLGDVFYDRTTKMFCAGILLRTRGPGGRILYQHPLKELPLKTKIEAIEKFLMLETTLSERSLALQSLKIFCKKEAIRDYKIQLSRITLESILV